MKKLVFIDTNIFLDFYRIQNEGRKGFLTHIDQIAESIVMTDQVVMEYKKNRQAVIVSTLNELKAPSNISHPGLLSDDKSYGALKKSISNAKSHIDKLKARLKRILEDPTRNDSVYKTIQRISKKKTDLMLKRGTEQAVSIRELAEKRWKLGYPPRKRNDSSIGDAINWEWIVEVAKSKKPEELYIVTRDSDFGITFDRSSYLNDWLLTEFKERVGRKTKIKLFTNLSEVLKLLDVKVTKEEEISEEQLAADFDEYEDHYIEGTCVRCGSPPLLDITCNKCGDYISSNEDGANYSVDENGKLHDISNPDHEHIVSCECGSDDLELEWQSLCSYCEHMASKDD